MREGILVVVVSRAANLHNTRSVSKQNPLCVVRIQNLVHRTKAIQRGGQSPAWDFEARFELKEDLDSRFLKVSIFDEGNKDPQMIGDVTIDLAPAYAAHSKEGYDAWHKITYGGKYTGEVYLEITYYPKTRPRRSRGQGLSHSLSQSAISSSASMSSLSSVNSTGSRRPLPSLPGTQLAAASTPCISRSPSPLRKSVESRPREAYSREGNADIWANTSMPDLRPSQRLHGSRSARDLAQRNRDSVYSMSALHENQDSFDLSEHEEDALAIPEPPEHLDYSFNQSMDRSFQSARSQSFDQSMHADHSFRSMNVNQVILEREPTPEPEPAKKNVAQINQWYKKAMFQKFRKA